MVDTTPPSTPTALTATAASSTSVQLRWAASTDNVGVTGYRVYRNSSQVATATTNQYTATGLSPSTGYTFHVAALDAAGNLSTLSAPASITTEPATVVAPLVSYDFSAGDPFVNKSGWSFAGTVGPIASVPGSNALGLRFRYPAAAVDSNSYDNGSCSWIEQPVTMPDADKEFFLETRLHIPTNYAHRYDVGIKLAPGTSVSGWQIGDRIRSADNTYEGIVSGFGNAIPDDGGAAGPAVFLRNPGCGGCNSAWVGTLRNLTRNLTVQSTLRRGISPNNKLMAVFADGYSGNGNGSTIIWEYWPNDPSAAEGQAPRASELAVHYSRGQFTGAGSHLQGTPFIGPSDFGKYIDIVFYGKFSSPAGASNGVIETWLRREGSSNFTRIHQVLDADMDKRGTAANPSVLVPWRQAKMMGWANSCFDTQTDFYISRIRYYDKKPAGF